MELRGVPDRGWVQGSVNYGAVRRGMAFAEHPACHRDLWLVPLNMGARQTQKDPLL